MKRHLKNRTVYRIYTEDKNRDQLIATIGILFENFTVTLGTCFWHGKKEYTVIIEIVDDGQSGNMMKGIQSVAMGIKSLNNQDEILLTETKADIRFLN